jgi:Flp pilus assembly protein TadG
MGISRQSPIPGARTGGLLQLATSCESGSVQIETALSYVMMMTCVMGIIEFCVMTYTYAVYADAARHGVRYATIHGSDSANCSGPTSGCGDSNATNVVNAVTSYAKPYTNPISGTTVQVSYPDSGGCTPPSRVIVTITYTYAPLFHYPGASHVFQVSSQGRILY